LYPNKFSKCRERTEYTSTICDNTAVVFQRNWSLSISRSVHNRCIYSYNSVVSELLSHFAADV